MSGLLGKTGQQSRIRLEGLTSGFVAPLEELLDRKGYLLSDEVPSSLDCLALGYLLLALVPDLPYSFLRDAVTSQSARLVAYVDRLRSRCFGAVPVNVGMVFSATPEYGSSLPWRAPDRLSVGGIGKRVLEGMADSVPILQQLRASQRLQKAGQETVEGEEQDLVVEVAKARRREVYASAATVITGLGMFVGYLFHIGYLQIGGFQNRGEEEEEEDEQTEARKPPTSFGEAGALLGI